MLVFSIGCARFSTTQTDVRYDDNGKPLTSITTKATAYTLIQSKSSLTNWKAVQTEGEQGAEVGGLSQESDTDVQKLVEALAALAIALRP